MSMKYEDNFEDDDLSASDDDAPEELGMSASKHQKLSQAQKFRDQESLSKGADKDRRRKRNDLFMKQKEKKLENINKRALALPTDVLDAVAAKSAKFSDEGDEEAVDSAYKPGEDAAGLDQEDRLSDSGVEDDSNVAEDEYIPLNSSKHGSVNVVTLHNHTNKTKSATESALEFRNSRLFGAKCVDRESGKFRKANRMKKQFKCQ